MVYAEKAPAFQFYADDRLAELSELTLTERGAWVSLVGRLWKEGPLPEERMRRIAGPSWETIRFLFAIHPVPVGYHPHADVEHWSLAWLESYRAFITIKRAKNHENGTRGGRPRKDRRSEPPVNPDEKTNRFPNGNHRGTTRALETEDRRQETEDWRPKTGGEAGGQDGVQGKDRNRRPIDAATDPRVGALIDFLVNARGGLSCDGSPKDNQSACAALLARIERDHGGADPVALIQAIITAGLKDGFHAKNITDFGYLFRNAHKIIQAHKSEINRTTTNGKRSATADVLRDIAHEA